MIVSFLRIHIIAFFYFLLIINSSQVYAKVTKSTSFEIFEEGKNIEFLKLAFSKHDSFFVLYNKSEESNDRNDYVLIEVDLKKSKIINSKVIYSEAKLNNKSLFMGVTGSDVLIVTGISKGSLPKVFTLNHNLDFDHKSINYNLIPGVTYINKVISRDGSSFVVLGERNGIPFLVELTEKILWEIDPTRIKDGPHEVTDISYLDKNKILISGVYNSKLNGQLGSWIGILENGVLMHHKEIENGLIPLINAASPNIKIFMNSGFDSRYFVFDSSLNVKYSFDMPMGQNIFGNYSVEYLCDDTLIIGRPEMMVKGVSTLNLNIFNKNKVVDSFVQSPISKVDQAIIYDGVGIFSKPNSNTVVIGMSKKMNSQRRFNSGIQIYTDNFSNYCVGH